MGYRKIMQRKLWVISELYYPEETSTGYFLTRIAEGLADDHNVHGIAAQPSYSERGIKAPALEERSGTVINRIRSTNFNKDLFFGRLLNSITFASSVCWFAVRNFRHGDQILMVTNPPTLQPLISLIASIRRCSSYLLVHDVYPEILVATKLVAANSFLRKAMAYPMDGSLKKFDRVIAIGRDMKELLATKMPDAPASKIAIITNWADVDEINYIPRIENQFALENQLVDKIVVQFSGNIGRTHDVETVLRVAETCRGRNDMVFLFVGYGKKSGAIRQAIKDKHLENVMLLPRQPRQRLAEMLSCSDVTIISLAEDMLGLSVPSRMYNVMAASRPIIALANPASEIARCVEEEDAGWVVKQDSTATAKLTEIICRLHSKDFRRTAQTKGQNGRSAAEAKYQFSHVIEQYKTILKN